MRAAFLVLWVLSVHAAEPVSYQRSVQPILAERCQMCHNARNASGQFSAASVPSLLRGGVSGPAVKPAQADASLLVQVISGEKPRMPKAGAPLSAAEVATIRRWIEEGARDDSSGAATTQAWWSLKPLQAVQPPNLKDPWIQNPIDAFILDKLRANTLSPSQPAGRRTLIRRVYQDLIGLPPTPAEVSAFVKDESPDAYAQVVDRLLASPRYGERWARHWFDVMHYGESHGYDKDKPRLNAWPYRDWVIRAFNEDKPYARFVQEQIAGDALFPTDPQALVATGFLAAGPWDFVGHQELREGTVDKDLTRVLDRDDMVATTVSTFTSMTAHCARCHDHKFDPIPQQDYYNLQAVFAGVDRADRPFDDDPALFQKRQALLQQKQAIQRRLDPLLDKVEFATSPAIEALDSSIQDASLLITHMGEPKTPAEAAQKQELETRRTADRAKRKQLVDAIVGPETYAAIERVKAEFAPIDEQLKALPKPRLVYAPASYFQRAGTFRPALQPRPVTVLGRGNVRAPGNPAFAAGLSCVSGLQARFELADPNDEGRRRAALAQWITAKDNMLTWRSIVNRVWQYHFGTGIVETASDFGRMGAKPSHPEMLDWLAVWFRDEAHGSLKQLHRLIVTSAAYQQASAQREDGAKVDADNRLLWRMNRTRLDAEAFRDSVLAVSGKIDLTAGGPPVQMFFFKDDHSPVYDYARFDPDSPGAYRRSIYRLIVRSVPDPFLERLDCPDPSVLTPKRSTTITAIQALAAWNNIFVLRMSEHFAELLRGRESDAAAQVREAIRLALGREATERELELYAKYAQQQGLANFCRVLFNTNEFLFID
ncbi:PSD1 and planctomycete cytochrome C domain-containing protein [Paludibaculum fermentans]|uniref:PSD1 domain-containing protein n=1 Tax=Paludibaculum fermentans TaxID=1473598 RepID=A0A7S7NXR0_PALFE|nr:PSD1 and planctomycete cytochrome C domain-containing protein [Paludibaculum fermentans]QOY91676.1 PSD1 domain-containing protein [Paludibaculum fermentans]